MIGLTVGNSYCQLTGLSLKEFQEVRALLSYTVDPAAAFFSGRPQGGKRCLMNKRGEFPTGLRSYVTQWASESGAPLTIKDTRIVPKGSRTRFNLSLGVSPYPLQENAVAALLAHPMGTLSACTGYGKSVMMAMLIADLGLKTLVIVPTLGLKAQLTSSFLRYFGNLKDITIENIDSKALQKQGDYDCLIIDEAHHVAAKTYRDLNKKYWGNIFHRYFFTATPFRNRDEERLLFESIAGEVIYRISYSQGVDTGAIVPIEAYYIELPKTSLKGINIGSWPAVYNALVVNNQVRNDLISKLLIDLDLSKTSTLCLVTEIKHGENLCKLTGGVFANGMDEDTKHYISLFNDRTLDTLVGTTGVLGEGIDSKPAEYVIIAGLGKSKPRFMQQVGRGVRTYPGKRTAKIIIFSDPSHKWTLAHFKAQVKILKEEYGVIPVKLDLTI